MTKVNRGVTAKQKHKKILKMAKGFTRRNKSCYRIAIQKVERSMLYAYRDRKNRKREFRKLWIERINAASREYGFTYSKLIDGLNKAGIEINRKMLSELAIHNKSEFKTIISRVCKN